MNIMAASRVIYFLVTPGKYILSLLSSSAGDLFLDNQRMTESDAKITVPSPMVIRYPTPSSDWNSQRVVKTAFFQYDCTFHQAQRALEFAQRRQGGPGRAGRESIQRVTSLSCWQILEYLVRKPTLV